MKDDCGIGLCSSQGRFLSTFKRGRSQMTFKNFLVIEFDNRFSVKPRKTLTRQNVCSEKLLAQIPRTSNTKIALLGQYQKRGWKTIYDNL